MKLVLLDDSHGVEGVLLGELGLDLVEDGAEVRRVLWVGSLAFCVSAVLLKIKVALPPRAWSTAPWGGACAERCTGRSGGCGRCARTTPWLRGA